MVKAVIFDVDGTLVDSVDQHAQAWQDAFREFDHDIEFAAIRKQIGKGGDQLLPVFLSEAGIEHYGEKLQARRSDILKQRYLPRIGPFPQVRALFERIRRDGTTTVLASSAKSDELQTYKRLAEIEDLVDTETTSEDADKSKPHPDIFKAALDRLKDVAASDAVVVGDTAYDAEAAGKAGIRTVGVLCGGFPEGELREAGCIEIYDDPEHLLREYERSALAKR